jgi:hypothetical protein
LLGAEIGDEPPSGVSELMPRSEMVKTWKGPYRDYGATAVRDFFLRNTPR